MNNKLKYRYENFGGIIASESPPFLAFVDRAYMKELGLPDSTKWKSGAESIGLLSAPTEVHFAITNKCSVKCPHCYMDGGKADEGELDTGAMKDALKVLSEMGVFHVAMGGGEAIEREDLFEIGEYARSIGLVPNLTISGVGLTKKIAHKLKVFGQVNISIDGINDKYGVFRGVNHFETASKAFDMLHDAGVPSGINCVIGKNNFDGIEDVFRFAKEKKLEEIEFLRYKPSGRGRKSYMEHKTSYEQNIAIVPLISGLSARHSIIAKIDCSFVPMLCYHNPAEELLHSIATYGCEAGNVLLGIRSNGIVSGCSFLENTEISVFNLPKAFQKKNGQFSEHRSWVEQAIEPCKSCKYLEICKGGCHAVSKFIYGDYHKPDPDCPFVEEYLNNSNNNY